jgi:cobalamin biosynthesis Mg chelatase CobN
MPKKSATARSGTQRSKAKAHKNIELVRPTLEKPIVEAVKTADITAPEVVNASTRTAPKTHSVAERSTAQKSQKMHAEQSTATPVATTTTSTVSTEASPKGSAAARPAARRQSTQKVQQRSSPALITPEHYSYVRRDLVLIAVLASIMFLVIIILHFVPGIGS